MIRTIEIGGTQVTLKATAAVPYFYKQIFGGDLMRELNTINTEEEGLTKAAELFERLAFIMSEHANRGFNDMQSLTQDDFIRFLCNYDADSFIVSGQAIMGVYFANAEGFSKAKK